MMDAINIHRYIYMGKVLRYLQDADESSNVNDMIEHINIFLYQLNEYKLPVTQRAPTCRGILRF